MRRAVSLPGVYHGMKPGMGWPLAVSAALMERKRVALTIYHWVG
ncbi:membrane protein [Antarctobacter heliothermus]|uniref:Membrane protein n=2 Tax=Antarctobacter heliothermus TaxID=74033 RepID=A0A222E021_9RHOB|nr:membrane protein [Antarctobacter heliothermus]